ncbi:MAG: leucyl/phenylalanyl-tRNA--protein transferase [Rhodobacteraceae bacterium]|nr:leucyl/phenylalanyl-tRNA--protein transferase [Paracoccaceae bacterium]
MTDTTELTPELLLRAYCSGVFPMAETAKDASIFWVDPEKRGILPLDGFHVSRSLRKRLLSGKYEFTVNTCFEFVLDACANREETWINPAIRTQYNELHRHGFAHSIEVWKDGDLAGGLYGVSIGSVFFGESMFSAMTDGSKLALTALVARLNAGGFTLLDTQFLTDHLATMGGIEIGRDEFRTRLAEALEIEADLLKLPADTGPYELWQLSTQTS